MNISTHMKKIYISLTVVLLLAISVLLLYVYLPKQKKLRVLSTQAPEIWYIPGWKNKGVSQEDTIRMLKKIFPDSSIIPQMWDSDAAFDVCRERADEYARFLASKISSLPPEKRCNLILIGHSLGGRIAVKTLAHLKNKDVYIRRGIFLGSAIPGDAQEIDSAILCSIEPCVNIYNRNDIALCDGYGVGGEKGLESALGAYGYSKPFYGVNMCQYEIKDGVPELSADEIISKHEVGKYIEKLAENKEAFQLPQQSGKKQNSGSGLPFSPWSVLEKCCKWQLERQIGTDVYRIVNAHDFIVLSGEKEDVIKHWKKYSTLYTDTAWESYDKINVMQDEKNTVGKILTSIVQKSIWENIDTADNWILQKNRLWKKYRIVDPLSRQRAIGGNEAKMREAFEDVKRQLKK